MISIIVPVYRSEKTLERCVESLCRQTYQNIEVIMVVDALPDTSGILADELAKRDERIRVIHQQNCGVSHARNTGVREAKGEYIQFVDSDDFVDKTLCDTMLSAVTGANADLAVCGFHHLYYGKDVLKVPDKEEQIAVEKEPHKVFALYEKQFLNMPWNKLYKKELIQKLFREDMDLGEDLLFNLDYIRQAERITVIPKALCYYIQDDRGTTLSTKRRKNRMENALLLYREIQSFAADVYQDSSTGGIAENRLAAEFMDELEETAFRQEFSFRQKKEVICAYYKGYESIKYAGDIKLPFPDHRILFFCFQRKWFCIQLILIELRGLLVKLVRRRKRRGTWRN